MVDLVDGLVGTNLTEQGASGRKPNGRTDSSAGFQSVLNGVAAESPEATSPSYSRLADIRPDIEGGNELPDSDHNLPLASDEDISQSALVGEPVVGSGSSDEGFSIAVTEDSGHPVPQRPSIRPRLTGELGELIRLIESDTTLESSRPGAASSLIGSDSTLDSSLSRVQLGTSAYGASLMSGVGPESGAKPMAISAQLAGDMGVAAQAKLTPSAINPDVVSSRVVAGAELDVSLENETIVELNRQLLSPHRGVGARPDPATALNQTASGAAPTMVSASFPASSSTIDGIARGTPVLTTADPEGFSASIATHLRVMKSGGVSEARLQLNPAELGRLSIQITSQDSEVKVAFVVESHQARQVIENAMPRLRDLLDSAGLDLTESGVDQRDKNTDDRNSHRNVQVTDSSDYSGDSAQIAMTVTIDPNRLVDAYA